MSTSVGPSKMRSTALTVYNLPQNISEQEVRSIFPSARYVRMNRHQSDRTGSSQGMCTVHFDNPNECQKVYAECQTGKTAGGLMLHVEFSSSWTAGGDNIGSISQEQRRGAQSSYEDSYTYSDNSEYYSGSHSNEIQGQNMPYRSRASFDEAERSCSERHGGGSQRYDRPRQDTPRSTFQRPNARSDSDGGGGCTLTVSNLPYSATESDIKREFVDAFKVILNLNDQGQSRGVAQVTFSTPEQCNAALYACNQKTMGGRALRGRINRDNENGQSGYHSRDGSGQRDQSGNRREMGGNRGYVDSHRDFGNNRNDYGGMQRGGYGSNRGFGGNRDYNTRGGSNQYRDFNNRRGRSGDNSGGRMNDYNSGRLDRDNRYTSGGPQGNRFAQRDERRDRSPNRNEPVRGYGGGKGPRITSAVIRGNQDRSSSSDSSSDDAN